MVSISSFISGLGVGIWVSWLMLAFVLPELTPAAHLALLAFGIAVAVFPLWVPRRQPHHSPGG